LILGSAAQERPGYDANRTTEMLSIESNLFILDRAGLAKVDLLTDHTFF